MATFALIHGGGDVGWYWHLVEAELRERGHDVVAPDLPCDDDSADLGDYADTVVDAIGDRGDLVVVGQSYGGFTAPLVADRLQAHALVLVAGMIPVPGEAPADWWDNTGYRQAVEEQARRDGGTTGSEDPFVTFYHDVPRALAEEALSRERSESQAAYDPPWPLEAWPDVPTGSCCVPRIASFRLPSCAGWSPRALTSLPTRSPPGTASRSAARRSWRTCWSATPSGIASLTRGLDRGVRHGRRLRRRDKFRR